MKLIAIIEDAEQYSPDDFRKNYRTKEIFPETTIGELIEWQKKIWPHGQAAKGNGIVTFWVNNLE